MLGNLQNTNAFLEDLMIRRGAITVSGNANRFGIEMYGGHVVEMTPFEPDASTYRNWYYYNTSSNILKRKMIVSNKPVVVAYWKQVSN
jgi:formylmethanofuran dehydrogenase subunit C